MLAQSGRIALRIADRAPRCVTRLTTHGAPVRLAHMRGTVTPELQLPSIQLRRLTLAAAVPEQREEGPLDGALPAVERWWNSLTLQQKAYTVAAVLALLYLLPKAFIFFIVGLERAFIGSLMAVEEAVVQLIFRTTAMGLTVGLGLLACAGLYVFLGPQQQQQRKE